MDSSPLYIENKANFKLQWSRTKYYTSYPIYNQLSQSGNWGDPTRTGKMPKIPWRMTYLSYLIVRAKANLMSPAIEGPEDYVFDSGGRCYRGSLMGGAQSISASVPTWDKPKLFKMVGATGTTYTSSIVPYVNGILFNGDYSYIEIVWIDREKTITPLPNVIFYLVLSKEGERSFERKNLYWGGAGNWQLYIRGSQVQPPSKFVPVYRRVRITPGGNNLDKRRLIIKAAQRLMPCYVKLYAVTTGEPFLLTTSELKVL